MEIKQVSVREEEDLNSLSGNTVAIGDVFYKGTLAKNFNQSWISTILILGKSLMLSGCPQIRSTIWYFGPSFHFFPFSWVLWITAVGPVWQGTFLLLLEMPPCAHDFTWPQVITSEVLSTGGLVWGRLAFVPILLVCTTGSELSL